MDYVFVALKSMFCYLYLIILLRFLGKKECSQLNIFDLVIFLLVADLMAIAFENGEGLINGVIATGILAVIDYFCSWIALKNKKWRDLLEGKPTYIVTAGKLNYDNMRKLRYDMDSLCQHLRQQGIASLSEVAFAILEPNGQLSVIKWQGLEVESLDPVIVDGKIMGKVLASLGYDENWLKKRLASQHAPDIRDIAYCVIEKKRLFFLPK